jgi:hypothetical protein
MAVSFASFWIQLQKSIYRQKQRNLRSEFVWIGPWIFLYIFFLDGKNAQVPKRGPCGTAQHDPPQQAIQVQGEAKYDPHQQALQV